ncbi:hypothetical protein [Parafrigoribacterium humi]|uniref:hypothetical protein n=1 Tax=Parafrigoribacterium humi TaxID=3144664 RepID=UPI0032EC0AD9
MTDDREGDDAADWLSAQFDPHEPDEPKATDPDAAENPAAPLPDDAAPDDAAANRSASDATPSWMSAAPAVPAKPATPPAPTTPAAPASGGFSWGLAPRGASTAEPAPAESPVSSPPAQPTESPAPPVEPHTPPVDPPLASPPPFTPVAAAEPFDASLGGPPSSEAEPPTMALPWESAGTELFTPVAASDAVAEPATELLSGFDTVPADAAAGSSIDSLFGESQFRDYDAGHAAPPNPLTPTTPAAAASKPERLPIPRSQKALLWIAGVLAALLVLIALFYLGTKIPQSAAAPAPTPTVTKSPTPSPTPTKAAVGPLAPGTYKWDRLLGGECIAPFDSPWAETFTVVDCTAPHPAQVVAHGVFTEPTAAATDSEAPATPSVGGEPSGSSYPGVPALQAQINLLCSTPAVIDFAAAGAYTDIQFTASYPATEKQWADGDHSYYCFVTRSSGESLTMSVAVPRAAPAS